MTLREQLGFCSLSFDKVQNRMGKRCKSIELPNTPQHLYSKVGETFYDIECLFLVNPINNSGLRLFSFIIIKITISSLVIGLKNSYFPLIHLPICYRTVCYRTVQQTYQIQSCSLNQLITTLVSIAIETVYKLLNLCILCQFFNVKFPFVT